MEVIIDSILMVARQFVAICYHSEEKIASYVKYSPVKENTIILDEVAKNAKKLSKFFACH